MKNKNHSVVLNARQLEMIGEISKKEGIDGVPSVLRFCLANYYRKNYEAKKMKYEGITRKPNPMDAVEGKTWREVCEALGGVVIERGEFLGNIKKMVPTCGLKISKPDTEGSAMVGFPSTMVNEKYKLFVKNGMTWDGIY